MNEAENEQAVAALKAWVTQAPEQERWANLTLTATYTEVVLNVERPDWRQYRAVRDEQEFAATVNRALDNFQNGISE